MFKRRKKMGYLHPDEIFLDSRNLPSFDNQQFEGRIERPLSKKVFLFFGAVGLLVGFIFWSRLFALQVAQGDELALRSENNTLRHQPIFAERGVITDRNGVELAWNNPDRIYIDVPGFAHALGYIGYPTEKELADLDRNYFPKEYIGRDGVEKFYNDILRGEPGIQIEEVDVKGAIRSNHVLQEPVPGGTLTLAIDSRLQAKLHQAISGLANERGFAGGAGVMMDVNTGEVIALTSYPEYDPNVIIQGSNKAAINSYFTSKQYPLLNRVVSGLYVPGSIIKPFVAIGALNEKVITPEKQILSTGALTVPNPYDKTKPSIFRDWKAHGYVDMRQALAVSSDVYFYQVGGGFGSQKGIGIANIDKYAAMFGVGTKTGIDLPGEIEGVIPTPEWKAENFDGEPWRLGDTYHTAIGQYGFQVTPLEMVRAVAGVATDGLLVSPSVTVRTEVPPPVEVKLNKADFKVVKEGMRQAVLGGTAAALNVPYVEVAAKTGTAELGVTKENVNSWVIGFFPYDHPRYAFAVMMEKGHRSNLVGATAGFRQVLDWLNQTAPEYFE